MIDFFIEHTHWFTGCVMLLSLVIGSFLNVVIHRMPIMLCQQLKADCACLAGEDQASSPRFDLAWPLSHCPHCHHRIRCFDNIPLLSYLVLRGRCRDCRTFISPRYPLLEILTAIFAGIVSLHFGPSLSCLVALLMLYGMLAMSAIDLEHYMIPDSLNYSLLWLGLLASTQYVFCGPSQAIFAATLGYLSLYCIAAAYRFVRRKIGMGQGDFKLFAALGACLGLSSLLPIILMASISASIVGLALLIYRRNTIMLPFGPFLCLAGFIQLLLPQGITHLMGLPT